MFAVWVRVLLWDAQARVRVLFSEDLRCSAAWCGFFGRGRQVMGARVGLLRVGMTAYVEAFCKKYMGNVLRRKYFNCYNSAEK